MSYARKRRCVWTLLAILAVWPLAHRYLVYQYDLSPWRFFGWAMYCQPAFRPQVEIFEIHGGQRRPFRIETLPTLERLVNEYERERYAWGRLAAPDDIGKHLLESNPEAPIVEVEITTRRLERATASIVASKQSYSYKR